MTKTSYFCKLPPEHIIKAPPQGLEEKSVEMRGLKVEAALASW